MSLPTVLSNLFETLKDNYTTNVDSVSFPDKKVTDEFRSWTHNNKTMVLPADEVYHNGTPSDHPRATNRRSPP